MLHLDQFVHAASAVAAAVRPSVSPLTRRVGGSLRRFVEDLRPSGEERLASVLVGRVRSASREERVALTGLFVVLAFVVL